MFTSLFDHLSSKSTTHPTFTLSRPEDEAKTSSSATSSSSVSADSYFPPNKIVSRSADRITTIFDRLIKNDEFKTIWEEVNQNVHKSIIIRPASELGKSKNVKLACLKIKKDCPPDCQKMVSGEKTIFPHTFGIYVNVEPKRTSDEIAFSIIFETCNAKFWPQHQELNKEAENSMIDIRSFGIRREAIEFEALQLANKISETIKQKTSLFPKSSSSPKILDFDTHLKLQITGGHFKETEKQFLVIKQSKHRRTQSSS